VLNYCDKNSRELQTVNLMAQRNVPVTFMQEMQSAAPVDAAAGPKSNEAPGAEPRSKPGSPDSVASPQPSQPKSALPANGSKLQEKKLQQKRGHARVKPSREGPTSSPSP